jgi:hypothetical protein
MEGVNKEKRACFLSTVHLFSPLPPTNQHSTKVMTKKEKDLLIISGKINIDKSK